MIYCASWLRPGFLFLLCLDCHCLRNTADAGQDDCSKTDTSADAVMRCVNAVRTNPQAFKSDYPCSSPWLSTISYTARSALRDNPKLGSSAQRQANDMARYVEYTGGSKNTCMHICDVCGVKSAFYRGTVTVSCNSLATITAFVAYV